MFHSKSWIRSIIIKAFVPVGVTHQYSTLHITESYWCWMWLGTSRYCYHSAKIKDLLNTSQKEATALKKRILEVPSPNMAWEYNKLVRWGGSVARGCESLWTPTSCKWPSQEDKDNDLPIARTYTSHNYYNYTCNYFISRSECWTLG